jgi:hypothetical protein
MQRLNGSQSASLTTNIPNPLIPRTRDEGQDTPTHHIKLSISRHCTESKPAKVYQLF